LIIHKEENMATEGQAGGHGDHVCESMENHHNHICQLITKVTAGEIIDMVDLPGFICENCARAANSAEYLCRPRSLAESGEQEG
jgi:hypothetical protein